jgi:hypothetical protein
MRGELLLFARDVTTIGGRVCRGAVVETDHLVITPRAAVGR